MADFTKFRSSVGGFNRSDVSNYIETLCLSHKKELQQLKDENEALQAQLADAKIQLDSKTAAADTLQQKLEATETALSSTEAALEEAMTMVEEQEALRAAEKAAAEAAASEEAADIPDYPTLELEAYRRAEATERLSSERAARLRQRLSDLLDNVSARYEESGQEIQVLTEDIRTNLHRLEEALSDLDVIFDETTGRFNTIEEDPMEE